MARPLALACLALLVASCDWTTFGTLTDQANGVALGAPDGYPKQTYGAVVTGYSGTLGGAEVSRVAVGAGADAPIRVMPLWDGMRVDLGTPTFVGCHTTTDCDPGTGAALAGIPSWRGTELCVVIGGSSSGALEIHCEGGTSSTLVEHFPGPAGIGFGRALAALPAGFPGGGLIAGAPLAASNLGALYRVRDMGEPPAELPVGTATTGAVSLGTRIAVAPLPSGEALVAATAPGTSSSRVVVLVLHTDGTPDVRACLDDTHAGAAGAIALGDVDGDGLPELAIGDDVATSGRRESVQLYAGTGLPAATSCGAWGAAPTTVPCIASLRSIDCAGGGFGSALAIGDVDGDGKGDLMVGAPLAAVQGTGEAGAVYLLPGIASGVDPAHADVLVDSSPRPSAHLGQVLAVAPSHGARAEVLAGAPGTGEAIVFLCSGLAGDGLAAGPRCVPP